MNNSITFDEFAERKKFNFRTFVCTINLVLILLGYQMLISIISGFLKYDVVEDSSVFTWPIRALCLGTTMLAILIGKTKNKKYSLPIILFIILAVMYFARAFFALQILPPPLLLDIAWRYQYSSYFYLQNWAAVIGVILSVISIFRTWRQIDYPLAVNIILILGFFALSMSVFGIIKTGNAIAGLDADSRIGASNMLNTIAFGQFGVSIFFIALFKYFYTKNILWKIFTVPTMAIALLIALRSGSRSPIAAIMAVSVVWMAFTAKNSIFNVCLFGAITSAVYLLRFQLIDLIGMVSPMTALRLEASMRYGESSGRDWLIEDFFKQIAHHPIFGSHLDLFGYAHNIFVDSYVMYGVILGNILPIICIFALIYVVKILKNREYFSVIALLFLQVFVCSMFSGCWGGNAPLQCLLILVLLYANETRSPNLLEPGKQKMDLNPGRELQY
ncbi:MAG: hypothetical protein IKO42_01900 [Opitutales bacterium]|nr:hypothetical protein [Opitutales bacterium]